MSYDLFGDGRTALKTSFGRYLAPLGIDLANANNPINTSINSVRRTWSDTNGNFTPDCDLGNFGDNGECGAINNANFGKNNPNATRYDDALVHGLGKRDYFWDFSTELQHELATGAFPISRSRAHTHRRHGHPLQTVPSAGLIERPQEKNRVDALR